MARVVPLLVAALLAGGFAACAIAQGDAADDASVAGVAPVVNGRSGDPGDAIRREGLTKILYGMRYQDAPARVTAPIEAELDALGGPDPSVAPLDGPDGPREQALQAEIDAAGN